MDLTKSSKLAYPTPAYLRAFCNNNKTGKIENYSRKLNEFPQLRSEMTYIHN